MVYKQVLFPDKDNNSIEMPEQFFGKKVEVIVAEVTDHGKESHAKPPAGKKVNLDELFEYFGTSPDFSGIDEIRKKAWPKKW